MTVNIRKIRKANHRMLCIDEYTSFYGMFDMHLQNRLGKAKFEVYERIFREMKLPVM